MSGVKQNKPTVSQDPFFWANIKTEDLQATWFNKHKFIQKHREACRIYSCGITEILTKLIPLWKRSVAQKKLKLQKPNEKDKCIFNNNNNNNIETNQIQALLATQTADFNSYLKTLTSIPDRTIRTNTISHYHKKYQKNIHQYTRSKETVTIVVNDSYKNLSPEEQALTQAVYIAFDEDINSYKKNYTVKIETNKPII
jgi:hypothetical protein